MFSSLHNSSSPVLFHVRDLVTISSLRESLFSPPESQVWPWLAILRLVNDLLDANYLAQRWCLPPSPARLLLSLPHNPPYATPPLPYSCPINLVPSPSLPSPPTTLMSLTSCTSHPYLDNHPPPPLLSSPCIHIFPYQFSLSKSSRHSHLVPIKRDSWTQEKSVE